MGGNEILTRYKKTKTVRPQHRISCKMLYYTHTKKTIINKKYDVKASQEVFEIAVIVMHHA